MTCATLNEQVAQYVAMKQKLGYRFSGHAPILKSFARYADGRDETWVRCETVNEWLEHPAAASQRFRIRKLRIVRGFAKWRHAQDCRHEVPADCQDLVRHIRPAPCLVSVQDIEKLLTAALSMAPVNTIAPLTWHYLFGLIAVTGMRISEALALTLDDLTTDGLTIRDTKFGKTRMITLHPSTSDALKRYLQIRRAVATDSHSLFVIATGKSPQAGYATAVFRKLALQAGLRNPDSPRGPTPHSLRHSFAVRSLQNLPSNADTSRHMLALTTYLGHAKVSDTYWYLQATPMLLHDIAQTNEQYHANCGGSDD